MNTESKKILLVSGCSYTDKDFASEYHPDFDTSWPKWPELVAEKLDMNCVNLAKMGAGNEYIYSSLLKYITENDTIQKWIVEDLVESDDVTPLDDLMDCLKSWSEDQGFDFKKINKLEVKNALIKAQEKTSAGPAIFGKNIKENAPNGSSRCPKFNFITVEDEE